MRVSVVLEDRLFVRVPDGSVWTTSTHPYEFWQRYLQVFEHVNVVARSREVASLPPDQKRADGQGVSFSRIPYYVGPWQYLRKARQLRRAAAGAIRDDDAVVLRVPGNLSSYILSVLNKTGQPYAVEVVADPYDAYAPGSVKHPLRPYFRWRFPRQLQHQCRNACASSYVTQHALQRKYPPSAAAFSTYYSDVQLAETGVVASPRARHENQQTLTLVQVGTFAQLYKAPDVLIDACAACVREGLDLRLVLIGDGKHRGELDSRASTLSLGRRVQFPGWLSPQEVRNQLDQADLFAIPSRTEGLPRALIEAMARGLPCIGSTVGGIPELLPPEDLVPPGDVAALASKIREVASDPERMTRMSKRNLETAKQYQETFLRPRRTEFYRRVRETTEACLARRSSLRGRRAQSFRGG